MHLYTERLGRSDCSSYMCAYRVRKVGGDSDRQWEMQQKFEPSPPCTMRMSLEAEKRRRLVTHTGLPVFGHPVLQVSLLCLVETLCLKSLKEFLRGCP